MEYMPLVDNSHNKRQNILQHCSEKSFEILNITEQQEFYYELKPMLVFLFLG